MTFRVEACTDDESVDENFEKMLPNWCSPIATKENPTQKPSPILEKQPQQQSQNYTNIDKNNDTQKLSQSSVIFFSRRNFLRLIFNTNISYSYR